ncbi:hypothetical protein GCM10027456_23930 [Kineosporia babensis]
MLWLRRRCPAPEKYPETSMSVFPDRDGRSQSVRRAAPQTGQPFSGFYRTVRVNVCVVAPEVLSAEISTR